MTLKWNLKHNYETDWFTVKGVFGGSNRRIPDTTNQSFPSADVSSVYKISPEQKDPTIDKASFRRN